MSEAAFSARLRRAMVQKFMSTPQMTEEDALRYFYWACAGREASDFEVIKNTINKDLREIGFQIAGVTSDFDGKRYLVLITNSGAGEEKAGSSLDAGQEIYFKKLLEHIAHRRRTGQISYGRAIDFATNSKVTSLRKNFSRTAAEQAIEKLIADKWFFLEVPEGAREEYLRPSARLQEELADFLRESCSVENCMFCTRLCLHGLTCVNCKARAHKYCHLKRVGDRNRLVRCTKCKEEFKARPERFSGSNEDDEKEEPAPMVVDDDLEAGPVEIIQVDDQPADASADRAAGGDASGDVGEED